jgi:two-component system, LytTR family, sensor kinase
MKTFKNILFGYIVSLVVVMAVNFVFNYQYYSEGGDWRSSVVFCIGMTTICCTMFFILSKLVFNRFNWSEKPTLKITLGVLIFATGGAGMSFLAIKGMVIFFHHTDPSKQDYIANCAFSAMISMIIGLMITAQRTLVRLRQIFLDNEHMKQEMIQSQYETLKSQVNPHFLFNSLNTLTVMIPRQPEVAVQFVEQMSKVFRYSLEYSGQNMIDLRDELKVVRSYLFLNEQRYDGKLKVDINLDDAALQKKIITQSLLMLVENAIKHNEISNENPLTVSIYSEGDYLVVKNTLQRKALPERSTNVGLDNIKKRYALATPVPAVVEENGKWFIVKIPLM